MATSNLYLLCIIFSLYCSFTFASVHGNSEVLDADKPYYIAQLLGDNLNLTRQLWKIGNAAVALTSSVGANSSFSSVNQQTKNIIYNYLLDSIPDLFTNEVFQNMTKAVSDELSVAFFKSDVASNLTAFVNENGKLTNDAVFNVLKHIDSLQLLQSIIQSGKSVIEYFRGNDSTTFIQFFNYLIEVASIIGRDPSFETVKSIVMGSFKLGYNALLKLKNIVEMFVRSMGLAVSMTNDIFKFLPLMTRDLWESSSFQSITAIIIDELALGLEVYGREQNATGSAFAEQNVTMLLMGILQHTNLDRMQLKWILAVKLVINILRQQKSELDCLKECMVTSKCKGVNYRSHWPLCDIVGFSEDITPETDCVYTDISKWSKSIAGRCRNHTCNDGEKCVFDGEKQKCVTAYGPIPKDCSDQVRKKSGVYTIFPNQHTSIPVFCDMDYQEGGWTIVQRRFDGSESFDRDWNTYKRGFGRPSGEYWIGNDNLHAILSEKRKFKVRFVLVDVSGEQVYAEYSNFYVGNEESNYQLNISSYSGTGTAGNICSVYVGSARNIFSGFFGTVGDGVRDHTGKSLNGMMFSTKDRDNDLIKGNCAVDKCSGWWHRACTIGNINGKLLPGNKSGGKTMHWKPWRDFFSLQESTMMIKPIEK